MFRILFSAVWAGMFLACGPGVEEVRSRDPRPDILLISLDTTRADHLSAYGYERKTSPALERLAEEGILFEAAYAPSATTGPSHATLFTSVSPISHGITKNGRELDLGWKTLAEVLGQEGYQTAAVVSSYGGWHPEFAQWWRGAVRVAAERAGSMASPQGMLGRTVVGAQKLTVTDTSQKEPDAHI